MPFCETFSRRYDDDGFTFHVESRVAYTECGPDGTLSLFDFLRKTTDISSEDIFHRGTSMPFLVEHGFARLLARSVFRFHRMPKINERIEWVTTEWKAESWQFVRDYKVKSESGELLVSGLSKWLLTDFNTRKILPVKAILPFRKLNTEPFDSDSLSCGKILVPDFLEKVGEQKIMHSHLDGNNHTDNAFYGAFIVNALPAELVCRPLIEFRINYSKELLLGDNVEMFLAKTGENRYVAVGKKNDEVAFVSELVF